MNVEGSPQARDNLSLVPRGPRGGAGGRNRRPPENIFAFTFLPLNQGARINPTMLSVSAINIRELFNFTIDFLLSLTLEIKKTLS